MHSFPNYRTGFRSFLGIAWYYHRLIRGFSGISSPAHAETSTQVRFTGSDHSQVAFDTLNTALTTAPMLDFPDFESPLVVQTDAFATAVGAVLVQTKDASLHQIQYAIRTLNSSKRNYSSCDRKVLSVIFALRKFRIFLLSALPFALITDHQALPFSFL